MMQEWKTKLIGALKDKLESITEFNNLAETDDGNKMIKSLFRIYPDQECGVMAAWTTYDSLPDVPRVELMIVMDADVEPRCCPELEHAMSEMNFYLPIGAAGIDYNLMKMYLRQVLFLDEGKSCGEQAAEIIRIYEIMMAGVRIVYPSFSEICKGTLTYDEAVVRNLLMRQEEAR